MEALDESVKCVANSLRYSELTYDRVVESTGPKSFGLDVTEVVERRKYVSYVQKEVEVSPLLRLSRRLSSLMTHPES